jgi:hypothetical protein
VSVFVGVVVVAIHFHVLHEFFVFGAFFARASYCSGVSFGSLRTNVVVGDTPGRHARHFHAVLNDPELLGRRKVGSTSKLRRSGV